VVLMKIFQIRNLDEEVAGVEGGDKGKVCQRYPSSLTLSWKQQRPLREETAGVFVGHTRLRKEKNKREMDCVTMKLVERETGLPLDLVVLINSFLYERLTDENFKQTIALWFGNKEECKFRFGHISDWKTSRVTNMERAFFLRSRFNEDIGRWNVSSVTDMGQMFSSASQFNQDIGQWDVRSVTNMACMFYEAYQFNQDIGQWDVSSVTNMRGMFYRACQFNQDISQWDVSNVTNMRGMFFGATSYRGVRWS
jgi:surface protein